LGTLCQWRSNTLVFHRVFFLKLAGALLYLIRGKQTSYNNLIVTLLWPLKLINMEIRKRILMKLTLVSSKLYWRDPTLPLISPRTWVGVLVFFYKSTEGEMVSLLISLIQSGLHRPDSQGTFWFCTKRLHTHHLLMFYMAFATTWHQVFATSLSAVFNCLWWWYG